MGQRKNNQAAKTARMPKARLESHWRFSRCVCASVIEAIEPRILMSSYALSTVANLGGISGGKPVAPLTFDAAGDLFGTTTSGGPGGDGTVFEIAKGATAPTNIVSFAAANGEFPISALSIDAKGNIFGTTATNPDFQNDSYQSSGTVFEIARGSAALTTLLPSSLGGPDYVPLGLTLDSSGNLFGSVYNSSGVGIDIVYEYAKGSTKGAELATGTSIGSNPMSPVTLDSNGDLFGDTALDGVFEVARGSTAIRNFGPSYTPGSRHPGGTYPIGVTIDSKGDIFGVSTFAESDGFSTVYEIPRGSTTETTIATFDGAHTALPMAALTIDSSGNLFGTTSNGGSSGKGTVFEITKGSTTITTIANFSGTDGADPVAALTIDSSGRIFGTTSSGGTNGQGTVFELNRNGTIAVTPAAAQRSTAGVAKSVALGSFTESGATGPFSVLVNWGDGSADTKFTQTTAGTITLKSHIFDKSVTHAVRVSITDSRGRVSNVSSFKVVVAPAAAAKLMIVQQPTSGTHGVALRPDFIVDVEDGFGNIVISNTSRVSFSISTGAVGGTLAGTVSAKAFKGVARFGAFALSRAGTYFLKATDGKLTPVLSKSIVIVGSMA